LLGGVVLVAAAAPAAAQSEPSFAGKTINLTIGYAPGSGNDILGRLVSRHLGKHIPGQPKVVAQNMPGAGSFKAVNYLYEVAPKDGTYFGSVAQTLAIDAVTDEKSTTDPTRLPYLGRLTTNIDVGVALKRHCASGT